MDPEEKSSAEKKKSKSSKTNVAKKRVKIKDSEPQISSAHIDFYNVDKFGSLNQQVPIPSMSNTNLDLTFDQGLNSLNESENFFSDQKKAGDF